MKSKKLYMVISVSLAVLLIAGLAGCTSTRPGNGNSKMSLEDIVEKLYENIDVPPYETVRLTPENFAYYSFVPYDDSLSAVTADALVNITPHSVVVIRSEKGDGARLAALIFKYADPDKWISVWADWVNVAYTDHYVVLIMSEEGRANAIAENFKSIAKKLDGMEMTLLSARNTKHDEWQNSDW